MARSWMYAILVVVAYLVKQGVGTDQVTVSPQDYIVPGEHAGPQTLGFYSRSSQDDAPGVLRFHYDGAWGPICGDHWGVNESRVACRQLDPLSTGGPHEVDVMNGTLLPVVGDVACSGGERSLQECDITKKDSHVQCYTYARVACSDGQVAPGHVPPSPSTTRYTTTTHTAARETDQRTAGEYEGEVVLVGGGLSYGRVEVWFNGRWGTVCDDGWDDRDAATVCYQLGYKRGRAKGGAHYGQGSGKIWLTNVQCNSYDHELADCSYDKFYSAATCSHGEDAGVDCSGGGAMAGSEPNRLLLGLGVMIAFVAVATSMRLYIRRQRQCRVQNAHARQVYRGPPCNHISGSHSLAVPAPAYCPRAGGAGLRTGNETGYENPTYTGADSDESIRPGDPGGQPDAVISSYPRQCHTLTPQALCLTSQTQNCLRMCPYPAVPVAPPAYDEVPTLPQDGQLNPGQIPGNCPLPPSYDSLYGQGQEGPKEEAKDDG